MIAFSVAMGKKVTVPMVELCLGRSCCSAMETYGAVIPA